MANYNYTAINDFGRKVRGTVSAENELDLETRLKEIGMDLVSSTEQRQKKAGFGARVKMKDLIIMMLHMEQLDRAGVPLHDALADVRDATESLKLRDIMMDVSETVKSGTVFSEALAKHPSVFNDVFVGLIAAGEKTGNLAEAFHHITEHMKWSAALRAKVKKALAYPIAVLVLMSLVITVLMLFVVPQLIDFILSQGFEVPAHTKALIWTSEQFQKNWLLIFGIPIGLIFLSKIFYRVSEGYAYRIDSFMLKLPIIGPTLQKIDVSRFVHFFAVMFRSGIDILESLDSASQVVNNRVIKQAVYTARRSIEEGNSLTASLRLSNQFPNLVIRMFKVGEDSGNLNDALENINFFYNREVNDAVDGMVGTVQPVMTILMGGLIFWVIAAIFGPLYQSFQNMNF